MSHSASMTITPEEFDSALRASNVHLSSKEVQQLFRDLDSDGNGAPHRCADHYCNVIEAPWLVNGGHGASLRHHTCGCMALLAQLSLLVLQRRRLLLLPSSLPRPSLFFTAEMLCCLGCLRAHRHQGIPMPHHRPLRRAGLGRQLGLRDRVHRLQSMSSIRIRADRHASAMGLYGCTYIHTCTKSVTLYWGAILGMSAAHSIDRPKS
eukprot:COSAG01_NODE_4218_length_5229_cov_16.645419_7_plen_207_part_00